MARHREFEGKDLAEALSRAARALGIAERGVHYKLLEGGRRGILGFGAKDVRILVEVPSADGPEPVSLEDVLAEGSKPILESNPDAAPSEQPEPGERSGAAGAAGESGEGRQPGAGSGRDGRKRSRGTTGGQRDRGGAGRGERRGREAGEDDDGDRDAPPRRRERRRQGGRRRGKASGDSGAGRADSGSRGTDAAEAERGRGGGRRQRGRRRGSSAQRSERARGGGGAAPGEAAQPATPPSGEHLEVLADTVRRMTGLMGMEIEVRGEMGDSGAQLLLDGNDHEMLLEKDAELLHALQFLLNRMSRRAWPGIGRIQVTCPGFSRRRDDDLVSEIKEVASQVARTGEAKKLHPMNPYERRLVHLTIRQYPGLATESEGSGFMKVITVSKVEGDD